MDGCALGGSGNPNTPPEVLTQLARDEECARGQRATHTHRSRPGGCAGDTSPETLAQLARDPDRDVRRGAARNPNTPPETLAQLARDPSWVFWGVEVDEDVRVAAAANPKIFLEDIIHKRPFFYRKFLRIIKYIAFGT